MKILLGSSTLDSFGSIESWTYTMADHLKKEGHKVQVLTFKEGIMSQAIKAIAGVQVLRAVEEGDSWDLTLLNCETSTEYVLHSKAKVDKIIQTIHTGLQKPVIHERVKHVATYPHLAGLVNAKTKGPVKIIMHPIDLERFKPEEKRTHVLSMQSEHFNDTFVFPACYNLKLSLERRSPQKDPIFSIHNSMAKAHTVIAGGRSAAEALASGCRVIAVGENPSGVATMAGEIASAKEASNFLLYNYQGHPEKGKPSVNKIEKILQDPNYKEPEEYRSWAENYFNVKDKIRKYLNV